MNILQISPQVPYPPVDGGKRGIFNITKPLAERGHAITMVALTRQEDQGWDELRRYCTLMPIRHDSSNGSWMALRNLFSETPFTVAKYHDESIATQILDIVRTRTFDVVHVDSLHCAYYGLKVQEQFQLPVILRFHDFLTAMMERYSQYQRNPAVKAFARLQVRKLRVYERNVAARFDVCVTVSRDDERKLKALSPGAVTTAILPGVDTEYFVPRATTPQPCSILWFGGLGWGPNIDSLRWFLSEIFPRILEQVPAAKLFIAGSGGAVIDQFRGRSNVEVLGFVRDIRDAIEMSEVSVVPLRIGSGVRLKILELFAMGKPVVSTTLGAEGSEATDGKELMLADTVEAFARSVVEVLRNQTLRQRLSKNARQFAVAHYDCRMLAGMFEEEYKRAIGMHARVGVGS